MKPEIVGLLRSGDFDTFSVPRLRDAYQKVTNQTSKPKKVVSQLVKRHLRKLEERGALERIHTGKAHPIEYRVIDLTRLDSVPTNPIGLKSKPAPAPSPVPEGVIHALMTKLNKYRTDMLLATGKLEEFEAIVEEQPSLKDVANKEYAQTRKEYEITLGKVKALESLIALHPNC